MADYQRPAAADAFTIEHLADFEDVAALQAYAGVDADTVEAVLEEAGKFADRRARTDQRDRRPAGREGRRPGRAGARPNSRRPTRKFREGGWPGIASNPDFGGQGLPKTISIACDEMWAAANVAFALCPELSQGAILALDRHGSDDLKQRYLAKLVSGEWTGTMCLTEPQAGSDLSALTTRAEPQADGSYLLTGRKIFITWGDHAMTENVVHLVLARLPGAPQGTKGISLFLVPKYKVDADGTLGERNDVYPVSVEHKLGIHASPTCVLAFGDDGGAQGYLVGSRERRPRRDVHDDELHAPRRRRAGRRPRRPLVPGGRAVRARARAGPRRRAKRAASPIIRHPDIRRTLLLMRSLTQACACDLLLHRLVPRSRQPRRHAGSRRPRGSRAAT